MGSYRYLAPSLKGAFDYLSNTDRALFPQHTPQYSFVIIGTGMMGMEHMQVIVLEGRATIHGIYDQNPTSMQAAKSLFQRLSPGATLRTYSSVQEACLDPEVDALIICTPNYTHLQVLKTAINSEKPILLEKPMASTLKDAVEIVNIASTYPADIYVSLQYRYKAIYQKSKREALQHHAIGDIHTISLLEHRLPFLDKVGQWNKFSRYSGGTLVEKCCHYFDLFNLFANSKPKTVSAVGGQAVNFKDFSYHGDQADIIDHAFVNILYENGIKAQLNFCMFAPMFNEEIILCGATGRIRAFEQQDFMPGTKLRTGFELHSTQAPSEFSTVQYPAAIQESGHAGATFMEYLNFIDNLSGKAVDIATPIEGLWSVIVGVAAEQSLASQSTIEIATLLEQESISADIFE